MTIDEAIAGFRAAASALAAEQRAHGTKHPLPLSYGNAVGQMTTATQRLVEVALDELPKLASLEAELQRVTEERDAYAKELQR